MRDDPFHVALHEAGNPGEVPVPGAAAHVHDPLHRIRIGVRIGQREHLIYDVAGGKELVLRDQLLVALPCPITVRDSP